MIVSLVEIHNAVWQYVNFSSAETDIFREKKINVIPDSKVHGANMGPIWGRQGPGGPHVDPMNFTIWDSSHVLGPSAATSSATMVLWWMMRPCLLWGRFKLPAPSHCFEMINIVNVIHVSWNEFSTARINVSRWPMPNIEWSVGVQSNVDKAVCRGTQYAVPL